MRASTPAGHTYDIEWPGDRHGGGSKPAIKPNKRADFIADVRGEGGGEDALAMTVPDLRKKWGKLLTSDRTLFKWVAWARKLEAIEDKPEPKKGRKAKAAV